MLSGCFQAMFSRRYQDTWSHLEPQSSLGSWFPSQCCCRSVFVSVFSSVAVQFFACSCLVCACDAPDSPWLEFMTFLRRTELVCSHGICPGTSRIYPSTPPHPSPQFISRLTRHPNITYLPPFASLLRLLTSHSPKLLTHVTHFNSQCQEANSSTRKIVIKTTQWYKRTFSRDLYQQ